MRTSLTLKQLESFVEVARTVNFREASDNLHVSQPALSRTIRLAEDAIGTRLFDRDTSHVALTPSGRELLPIATRILQDFDSAFSELGQFLDGHRGHITAMTLASVSVALLTPAVASFRQMFPQVGFTLLEGQDQEILSAVAEGRADFGISMRPKRSEPFSYTHLLDDPFVLLCRDDDPLACRPVVQWSVFEKRPFLPATARSSIRPLTDAAILGQGLHVSDCLAYPSIPAVAAMVRAELGVTAVPRLTLQLLDMQGLTTVPLVGPVTRPIGLVTRTGRSLSPAVRAFMEKIESGWREIINKVT
ncbi:LysR family transcriptional regulator [Advenella kashmirensis W13003]|uniref:LysR family transcriptional regulator n=1 Tax=Advenella kashmirensis W13003 TaxID=1424334 RepID=V8QY84_9BURK|nr:LysR family transcriptional regulator [Advenella kashmirensis]ETF04285.1 LysR family transcriptional regulator [Advenella kashmirensis W13003]